MKSALSLSNAGRYYILSLVACLFFLFGCEDQITTSQPGVLEIHLKSITTRFLPTSDSARNGFRLQLTSLSAYRSNRSFMRIFSDVRSTERFPEPIDMLDSAAFDSSLMIGQSYMPPINFSRIDLTVTPVGFSFYNGYNNQQINVFDSRPEGQEITQVYGNIPIKEFKKTIVTITCDVDSSLVQQSDNFLFVPKFWISSIKIQ